MSPDRALKQDQDSAGDWHGEALWLLVMLRTFASHGKEVQLERNGVSGTKLRASIYNVSPHVGTTIVLAEDEFDLRTLYAESLRLAGHIVWEAADGGEALAHVRTYAPELLLLDIWMPVLNGLEVLDHLSSNPQSVGLKVVVLSNQSDADTRLESFALGAHDYWPKDLSLDDLCERIARLTAAAQPPT